jgi:Domain of unknown function (DUF4062)
MPTATVFAWCHLDAAGVEAARLSCMTDRGEAIRPHVFVSSIMDGFEEYRLAARQGIIAAGGTPVLVEDFPSLPLSPRTACLDGVASCDIYIGIVGNRGGWTAPSGKLVVEEEFEEARDRKLRTLAFIQDVERDEGAARLVRLFSDYIAGMFRQRYSNAEDLRTAVERALAPLMEHYKRSETDHTMIEERLKNIHKIQFCPQLGERRGLRQNHLLRDWRRVLPYRWRQGEVSIHRALTFPPGAFWDKHFCLNQVNGHLASCFHSGYALVRVPVSCPPNTGPGHL